MKRATKWDSLDSILDEIWAMLKKGVTNFRDPFHWPVLGTVTGDSPTLRTVILRGLILPERILVCHADSRSPKVKNINDNNKISWLFYNPRKEIQLRLSGIAELHANDRFADVQWEKTKLTSRLNYCAIEPPGTPVTEPSSGLPDFLLNKVPNLLETEKGRINFMTISCRIDSIDWLRLSILGNRRARFEWDSNGVKSAWLIP